MVNLKEKIKTAPQGFAVDEVDAWLSDIPFIKHFETFDSFFEKNDFSAKDWFALIVILNRRYVNELAGDMDFSGCYENYLKAGKVTGKNRIIRLVEDKSIAMDFTTSASNLEKITLKMVRACTEIVLPGAGTLEMLSINFMPKLNRIENLSKSGGLRYLAIDKCNNFTGWDDIKTLSKLSLLSLSDNNNLPELTFLDHNLPIVVLQLIATNAMKLPNTIEHLAKLKKLRYLNIKATPKELQVLREALPACIINGTLT